MLKAIIKLFVLNLIFISTLSVKSQAISAYTVMDKNDKQSFADSESLTITMILTNKQGGKRERVIEQFSKINKEKNRSLLIKFSSPADIKGTGFLSIENKNRDDDQWLYLPAFNKTRRISANNESDYFVSSDFSFEDLNREDLEEYSYQFLSESKIDGADCYQIEAKPKTEKKRKESGYGKRILFIDKNNFVLRKALFYNKQDVILKEFYASDIKKSGEHWRAYTMKMRNIKKSHSTTLLYTSINLEKEIDDNLFTERYLVK